MSMLSHDFNKTQRQADLWVHEQAGLRKSQVRQDCSVRPCLVISVTVRREEETGRFLASLAYETQSQANKRRRLKH